MFRPLERFKDFGQMTFGVGADIAFKLLECGKEKRSFLCERRPVCAVAIDEVKAESFLGLLHDSPGFAVGHAHVLGGFVERAIIAYATAKHGDASTENGIGLIVANAEFDVGRNIIERNHGGPFDGAVFCWTGQLVGAKCALARTPAWTYCTPLRRPERGEDYSLAE